MFEYSVSVLQKKLDDVTKAIDNVKVYSKDTRERVVKATVDFMELQRKKEDLSESIRILEELGAPEPGMEEA